VKREAQYQHNTLDGFLRDWSEDGVLEREDEYEKGVCIRRKSVDSSGKLVLSYELSENDPQYGTLQLLRKAKFNQPSS
jgi:antitoxin component YwqK of YwqJK toxin-antitoxin module